MIRDLPYDAHVQTALGQGEDSPAQCVRAAEAAGLRALALVDHYDQEESQAAARLEAYARAAERSRVRVVAGALCDILDPLGRLTLAEPACRQFPLVLVRLSPLTEGVARATPVRIDALLKNLLEALVRAVRRPGVNVLSAPFNLGRFTAAITPAQIPTALLEELAGVMRAEEVAFELNNTIWSWYPELSLEEFLDEYTTVVQAFSREGVKFVAGSEARSAAAVGNLRFVERLTEAAGLEKSQLVDLSRLKTV
jgi:histidinol phosphatase-like PHP family hydrolase